MKLYSTAVSLAEHIVLLSQARRCLRKIAGPG